MFKDLIGSMLNDLSRTEFGSQLRNVIAQTERILTDSFSLESPGDNGTTTSTDATWDMGTLRTNIHSHILAGKQFQHLPLAIDLSGLGPAISRLQQQSADGFEYGRAAHIRISDARLELGDTAQGKDQVEIACKISANLRPVIMIHTHPAIANSPLSPCHFSPQDFHSFMDCSTFMLSVVLAPKAGLMMVKTDKTPSLEAIDKEYFENVFDTVASRLMLPRESIQARATQVLCRSLNMGLYIRKADAPDYVFHQVKLKK